MCQLYHVYYLDIPFPPLTRDIRFVVEDCSILIQWLSYKYLYFVFCIY